MKWPKLFLLLFIQLPFVLYAGERDTVVKKVTVSFAYSKNIFPESWQPAPINARGEMISAREVSRSKTASILALQKYPEALLDKNLSAVYWLKNMHFYDVGYGGTNSNNALFLTNDGEVLGYTMKYMEQTLHHEFSSILYRNYKKLFSDSTWIAANAYNFDYTDPEAGVGAIRKNASSQDIDTALCAIGMLTQYAMSGLENDLNTFAQNLFCPSPGFWKVVDNYPRIRTKVSLLISFYNKLAPLFTETYFRQFDNSKQ